MAGITPPPVCHPPTAIRQPPSALRCPIFCAFCASLWPIRSPSSALRPPSGPPRPMKSQPNRDYLSNDDVQTPPALTRRLVAHFHPTGHLLEPCCGEGNFLRALRAHARAATATPSQPIPTGPKKPPTPGIKPALQNFRSHSRAFAGQKISRVSWSEIKRGRDFFAWTQPVDWIITNPPWSEIRRFLQHAMTVADHVVFLVTINHLWTKARVRDIREAGFGIREIVLVDMPKSFPQSGFQLGAVYLSRGRQAVVTLTDWTATDD